MPNLSRTYAIGDVQGCLEPLHALLQKIHYNPKHDRLWFTGDLANRGPYPLETLRFIQNLPESTTVCVLGNHDLALLALSVGAIHADPQDTHTEILEAPDKEALLTWLRHRPLLHHDTQLNYILSHAGIYPAWDLNEAKNLAKELETALRGKEYTSFLKNMYGNTPTRWEGSLHGWERLRFISNALTRMRFCTPDGELELHAKGTHSPHPAHLPWFMLPHRLDSQQKIIFGHWAALEGKCPIPHIYPIDTGCVWGKCLTAFCLETQQYYSVHCQ